MNKLLLIIFVFCSIHFVSAQFGAYRNKNNAQTPASQKPPKSAAKKVKPKRIRGKKPNVLIFLIDDLGYGDVGMFGTGKELNHTTWSATSMMNKITNSGAKLTHHLSAGPECVSSRAGFLTGRYPVRFGMSTSGPTSVPHFLAAPVGLPPSESTVADHFRKDGYATAFFGKWDLGLHCYNPGDFGHHPLLRGFDYFYGMPLTNLIDFGDDGIKSSDDDLIKLFIRIFFLIFATYAISNTNKMQSRNAFVILFLPGFLWLCLNCWTWMNLKHLSSILMRNFDVVERPVDLDTFPRRLHFEVLEWLKRRIRENKPFFTIVSFDQVHPTMHKNPMFADSTKHGPYGDNLAEADHYMGVILRLLEEKNLMKDTIIYFSSDHGADPDLKDAKERTIGGHNGAFKGKKFQGGEEGGIRVPAAIQWMGHIPKGIQVNRVTSMMDMLHTLTYAAGIRLNMYQRQRLDGKNLWPLLQWKSNRTSPHNVLFHYCGEEIHAATYVHHITHEEPWKMYFKRPISNQTNNCFDSKTYDPPLLYNLKKNPYELRQPVNPKSAPYIVINKTIMEARKKHELLIEIEPAEPQFTWERMLWRPHWQPRCGKFPHYICKEDYFLESPFFES